MARRVNTKFLIILTVLVVGTASAALVAGKVLLREDPQAHIDAAHAAMEAGDVEGALREYDMALSLQPRNATVWVDRGDAYYQLVGADRENIRRAQKCWAAALEVEPLHRDALSRLAEFYFESLSLSPRDAVKLSQEGQAYAQRLTEIAPDDQRAAALPHLFTLRAWLMEAVTGADKVETAAAALQDLVDKGINDGDVISTLALVHLRRAQDVAQQGRPSAAEQHLRDAAVVLDKGLEAHPDNTDLLVQSIQIQRRLAKIWKPSDSAERDEMLARMQGRVDEALKSIEPTDPQYVPLHLEAAQTLSQTERVDEAEALLRTLNQTVPDDQRVRVALATILQTRQETVDEALAVLEKPVVELQLPGLEALRRERFQIMTDLMRADIRMDIAGRDAAVREAQLAAAETDLASAAAALGDDHPRVLKIRGKLQWINGQHIPAIQTLSRALSLMERDATQDVDTYETMYLLARAYLATNQTGQAKALLERILAAAPAHHPSRIQLAQLLIAEHDLDAARRQVEILSKAAPDQPDVVKLQMLLLNPETDAEQMKTLVAQLPEQTTREKIAKAVAAGVRGMPAETQRLLSAVLADEPGNLSATLLLAQYYVSQDQRDQAVALVDSALATHPDNLALQLLKRQISGASIDELRDLRGNMVEQTQDPALREVLKAELEAADGNLDAATAHLVAAEKLEPNNARVLEALFRMALQRREWDKAEGYAARLGALNADQTGGRLTRLHLAMARGQTQDAIAIGQELTKDLPEFAGSWLALGRAYQAAGNAEAALQPYRSALERQPTNTDALRGLIESSLAAGQVTAARDYIDQALKISPGDDRFKRMQIQFELAHGDPEKALQPLRLASEKDAASVQNWIDLGRGYLAAGEAAAERGDEAAAIKHYTDVLTSGQEGLKHHPDDRRLAGLTAEGALRAQRVADAEAVLDAFAQQPAWKDTPEPQMMRAEVHARAGQVDRAEAELRELLERHPDALAARLQLADLLTLVNRNTDALVVLSAGGDDPRIMRQRIELRLNEGQLDEADSEVRAALAKSPESIDLLALSGRVYLARGQWDQAAGQLEQILRLDPENVPAARDLALVRLQQPQPDVDAAVALLSAARDRAPQDVRVRTALATAYRMRNQTTAAINELDAALQLQPANRTLRLTLIDLLRSSTPPRWLDVERTLREGLAIDALKDDPDLLHAEANMWMARNDPARARASIRRAIAAAPDATVLAITHLNILLATQDYAALRSEADALLTRNADLWWAYQARGVARQRGGDAAGASADFVAALNKAIEQGDGRGATETVRTVASEAGIPAALGLIEPLLDGDGQWKLLGADLRLAQGDLDGAIALAESAHGGQEARPADRLRVLKTLSSLYIRRGTPEALARAKPVYEELLTASPNDVAALNDYAWLLSEGLTPSDVKGAATYSAKAYELMRASRRQDPFILDTHGWLLVQNEQLDQGIELLRESLLVGNLLETRYHLGAAFLKKADLEQAERELDQAAEQVAQMEQAGRPAAADLVNRIQEAQEQAKKQLAERESAVAR